MDDPITLKEFHRLAGDDWRVLSEGAFARYGTGSFAAGAAFAAAVATLEGLDRARPDLEIRHDSVTVRLLTMTDGDWGMSLRDLDMARRISGLARDHGFTADPSALQTLLVIPGAPDISAVTPFWRAVLGYVPRADSPEEDLVDPHDRGPSFWFERMDEPAPGGGGAIHLSVWVPWDRVEERIGAALAAGGRMVRDRGPAWWTLADAAGNEVDISTTVGRD